MWKKQSNGIKDVYQEAESSLDEKKVYSLYLNQFQIMNLSPGEESRISRETILQLYNKVI